jgi:Zn-dependent protease
VSLFSTSSGSSLSLGRVFGIQVRVHYLWFLVPLLFVQLGNPIVGLLVLLALFGAVFLHELGHSLVAQHFGIRVIDITFWPLGGMARMTHIPEDSKVEGLIAIAGPAVNFVLASLSLVAAMLFAVAGLDSMAAAAALFIKINLVLGVFNLIPAFPMDGGRILRAFLGRKRDWVTATEMAVKTGRYIALAMVVFALTRPTQLCVVPLIAAFVWFAGGQELFAVRVRHGLSPFGNLFGDDATGTGPSARPGGPGGAWTRARQAFETEGGPAVEPGPRRPEAWPAPEDRRELGHPGRGFTDEDIDEMERFRGRWSR